MTDIDEGQAEGWELLKLLRVISQQVAEIERLQNELAALSQDDGKVERALIRSQEENERLTARMERLERGLQSILNLPEGYEAPSFWTIARAALAAGEDKP